MKMKAVGKQPSFFCFLRKQKKKHKFFCNLLSFYYFCTTILSESNIIVINILILMKKAILSFLLLYCMTVTQAASYKYLVVEKTDGTRHSMEASGLTLMFSEGNLVASDGTSIALTQLTKMYFSDVDAIEEILSSTLQGTFTVYTLSGEESGTFDGVNELNTRLPKGIYIIKDQQGNTAKIQIR